MDPDPYLNTTFGIINALIAACAEGAAYIALAIALGALSLGAAQSALRRADRRILSERFNSVHAARLLQEALHIHLVLHRAALALVGIGGLLLGAVLFQRLLDGVSLWPLLWTIAAGIIGGGIGDILGRIAPERVLLLSTPLVLFCVVLHRVVSGPFSFLLSMCARFFGMAGEHEGAEQAVIEALIEQGSQRGSIEQDEREMIQGVFDISGMIVREVMTPRPEVITVPIRATLDEVVAVYMKEGVSRVVVVGDSLDDVRGVLNAKDLIPLLGRDRPEFSAARFMRPAHVVPNSKRVDDLLADFKRSAIHFAVVLDEHGGVDGVVTVEDLIEEVIGDIFDEYDSPAEESRIARTKSGDLIVHGSVLIEDLNQRQGLDLPLGEYDTVAGLLLHRAGRVPQEGEVLDVDNQRFRIEEVQAQRIMRVRLLTGKRPMRAQAKTAIPLEGVARVSAR